MLAGAETHAGIDLQHFLTRFGPALQPARFDDQPVGDREQMKILFPDFRPVLLLHLKIFDIAHFQPERRPVGDGLPDAVEIVSGGIGIERIDGVQHPAVLPVFPTAEIQFQRRKHLSRQIEAAGVILQFHAIKHLIHDLIP